MQHLTKFSPRGMRRTALTIAVAVAALHGCATKDAEFFSLLSGSSGTVELVVQGAPDGATVRVVGGFIDESRTVGTTVSALPGLPFGNYTVTVTPPGGYTCNPTSIQVTISESDPIRRATFECEPNPGTFAVGISGLSGGSQLDFALTGPTSKSGSIGVAGMTFTGLLPGSYDWVYPQIEGYDCEPASGEFVLEPGEAETAAVACTPTDGGITVSVSGATAMVSFSGPESGGGSVGSSPVSFGDLTPGTYTVAITNPTGFNCLPATTQVTVTAGTVTPVMFECAAVPGTITATVTGTTAQVNYSGAATGGGEVGATPVAFSGLPAGNYNVSVVAPDGFLCTPESIAVTLDAGENETVGFECEEEAPEELIDYDLDLANLQGAPGAVPAGSYNLPVRDATLAVIASLAMSTIGNQTFFGLGPARLGFGGVSGYQFDVLFPVAALWFRIRALQVCAINAALSGTNFVALAYYTAAMVLISSTGITSAPGCFWYDVPEGTRFIRMTGPAIGFVDIYNLILRGVLGP